MLSCSNCYHLCYGCMQEDSISQTCKWKKGGHFQHSSTVLTVLHAALQRRYNTLSLLDYYLGHGRMQKDDLNWNYNDPNLLTMTLPGGLDVTTRVTRRSENEAPPDRLDTSEYFQQVLHKPLACKCITLCFYSLLS